LHRIQVLCNQPGLRAHHHKGVCHRTAGAGTIHPSEGENPLDGDGHDLADNHILCGLAQGTDPSGSHGSLVGEVTLDYVPTELYAQSQICCGSPLRD